MFIVCSGAVDSTINDVLSKSWVFKPLKKKHLFPNLMLIIDLLPMAAVPPFWRARISCANTDWRDKL